MACRPFLKRKLSTSGHCLEAPVSGMGACLATAESYWARCGARFLCRDLDADVRRGGPGHLAVIIEFESLSAAKAASLGCFPAHH